MELSGKSHGQRSLVGYSPRGHKESNTTERLHFHFSPSCIGEGNGNPLQYSCLENPMDEGAWWAAVHGVAKSRTRLSDFTFTFHFHALEKELATHTSFLAWRIPGMGEPGGLPSMGSHRVRHDWSNLAAAAKFCYERREVLNIIYWFILILFLVRNQQAVSKKEGIKSIVYFLKKYCIKIFTES